MTRTDWPLRRVGSLEDAALQELCRLQRESARGRHGSVSGPSLPDPVRELAMRLASEPGHQARILRRILRRWGDLSPATRAQLCRYAEDSREGPGESS